MKGSKTKKLQGEAGFNEYYSLIFKERWEPLKQSLLEPVNHFELKENLRTSYFLDKASVYAANAMPFLQEGKCLDMCAAPGGKTLVLITERLSKTATLQANELSRDRLNRLRLVLSESLFESELNRIEVTGYDASKMPNYIREAYDRILLDAPCSSERHVLQAKKYLDQWSESRVKQLAQRQWSLLSAAFLLLKTGGFLVYSTCALSEVENDNVVERLLKKYKNAAVQTLVLPEKAEPTKHGVIFLPDVSGYGPLYFSLIKKEAL